MTAPASPPTPGSRLDATKMRRISLASMIGTTVEW